MPTRRSNSSFILPPSSFQGGSALLIVLAFVVLLTGLTMAFFSRVMSDRQVSNSSASQTKVELFAQGAVEEILGDLKQEILAGSTNTITSTGTLSIPNTNTFAIPALSGTTDSTGNYSISSFAPNLLKRSAYNQPFYSGPGYNATVTSPSRASKISTTGTSVNGRSISLARWNKALLLPRSNSAISTDLTPVTSGTGAFIPPDWVLVARSGNNPVVTASIPAALTRTASAAVVGRYAYAIYNEGGLLDMNVAGSPIGSGSSAAIAQSVYKPALSYADLHQLPGISDIAPASRQDAILDSLVAWRNYASAQTPGNSFLTPGFELASGSNYYNFVLSNTTGFLTTGTATRSGQTDRMFISRQHLIDFLIGTSGLAQSAVEKACLQSALQYMGTFSRDLNQPSFAPFPASPTPDATHRPAIIAGDGGNDVYGGDDPVNPSFLTIRATSAFMRNDGAAALIGEPLVKKRFALNRLAWLTYLGPSASRATATTGTTGNDADIGLLESCGISKEWLDLGTQDNIYKYFGLYWDATNSRWVYNHSGITTPSSVPAASGPIKTLGQVAAAGREPDFVELLKGAINAGAIAKGSTRYDTTKGQPLSGQTLTKRTEAVLAAEDYQYRRDISTDYAIIQIAANIIDQFDTDGYPTVIAFNGASPSTYASDLKLFRGVENLPFIYRLRNGAVKVKWPNTFPYPPPASATPTKITSPMGPMKDAGLMVALVEPEVWNPHDPNSSLGNPHPTNLRLIAESTDPDGIGTVPGKLYTHAEGATAPGGVTNSYMEAANLTYSAPFYGNYQTPFSTGANYAFTLNADLTALNFNYLNSSSQLLFAEPTLLVHPNQPSGSNLAITSTNNIVKFFNDATTPNTHKAGLNTVPYGIKTVQDANLYIGILNGVVPLQYVMTGSSSTYYIVSAANAVSHNTVGDSASYAGATAAATYSIQYQNPAGTWVAYDQKYAYVTSDLPIRWDFPASSGTNTFGLIGNVMLGTCSDPRTRRFGFPSGRVNAASGAGNTVQADCLFPPDAGGTYLDTSSVVLPTNRSGVDMVGLGLNSNAQVFWGEMSVFFFGLPVTSGWYPNPNNPYPSSWHAKLPANPTLPGNRFFTGLLAQNDPNVTYTQTIGSSSASFPQYYSDPDGVVRRAMGAYATSGTTGLPTVTANTFSTGGSTPTSQSQSRPIILNRPFRSVAELGYVHSGTPWKNLDMATPESGYAALLDVFCINETADPGGLVAGKVNLNTRQTPVIQSILAGAYKDELTPGSSSLTGTVANTVAQALTARTMGADGPLTNLSELVGKWVAPVYVSGAPANGIDGSKSYDGFSQDLSTLFASDTTSKNVSRFREASLRALANTGSTRVWNLMIDMVAQTGRYPNTGSPDNFVVEGEQRYWVHVAIDRLTGQIIDQQIEMVKE